MRSESSIPIAFSQSCRADLEVHGRHRCRAHHGSRPGFTQLEKEWECLSLIEKGVTSAEKGEVPPEIPRRKKITIEELRRIVEETE